jgi:hypothetical protein
MRYLIVSMFPLVVCACGGAEVRVQNRSSTRLEEVVISAQGDSAAIDVVEPSAERKTAICPRGEAGSLELSFRANGTQQRSAHPLYFECNSSYRVVIDVSPELDVAAALSVK